jgi:DNA-binding response OmpR family regulator
MAARTALLIDDDPTTGDSVRELLPWPEVKLEMTGNADEAIDCLRTHTYCGLVLNLDAAGGRDVLREMSASSITMPIVLIASEFPDALRDLRLVDDIKLVMARPFDFSLLAAMILGLCGIEM